ncbi:hypothetical protein QN277_000710 [Acacia crassicarpa]|uniref:DUF4378 domain-containing protein n=1 Tax=Acacia crassicarpa TaxID=499986 RepID=A0AAE1N714_9FABA|nr:hypothetical protein QN277_000710 [Acacia crassicarpa]
MYRSFMTCDDPKGVVECGAIRKYRSQKMKSRRRTAEKSEASLPKKLAREEMVPKGSTQSSVDPSSLQLMEVSRGAQRLNNMIDTWSWDMRCNGRSGDIAKDLLKGALDLQESLTMLRKLQEASQHKSCLKKKQNEKSERGRIDAKAMDGANTDQFSEQSYPRGFERPRLSADGSSRNCSEELKKVIKDSLVRQNLFTMPSSEGLDSASEIPSTSSSQSSGVHTDKLSNSSYSSGTSKVRGTNLVAKLMGLEEAAPSRPFLAVSQKQLQGEKILNQKRPTFEIDIPKLKKTSSTIEKVDPERKKTLSEILETIHFKGLLKKSSVLEPNLWIHHLDDYHHEQCDDLPPIVLMKPRCSSYQESVKSHALFCPDPEGPSLRKRKADIVPSKSVKQKGSTSMGSRADVTKRLTREEKPKILKEFMKLDEKAIMPIEKSPNMVKSFSHASHKPQVQEAIEKKAKVKTVTRKLPEKEISRPKILTRSQDREVTSTKLRTPPSELTIIKEIPCQQSTALVISSKTKTTKHKNFKQRKNQNNRQKLIPEPEEVKPVDEQLGREEEKTIAIPCEDDCTEIRTITEHAVEFRVELELDASTSKIDEDCYQSPNSSGNDVALLKVECEIDAASAGEAHDGNNGGETDSKADKEGTELKYFLLTNPLFVGHAEELLNLDMDCPMTVQKYETNEIANPRLYLDCANELTERKSLQDSQMFHPILLTQAGNSRLQISLGKLVEEIYNAIEKLKFYTTISGEKFSVDNLYATMKRDIKCLGLINGIWDWGWRYGFSAEESEQVVNEVESLVLSGLIEELIVDL